MNVRQRDAIYRELKDDTKIIEDHMIVSADNDGVVDLCTNTATPYACTTKSTKSKRKQLIGVDEYDTGADVPGKIKLTRTGLVDLSLDVGHLAINVGDKIVVGSSDDGTVDKAPDAWGTNDELCVAVAEEKVAVAASGSVRTQPTVKAYLNFVRYGGM
jgi:hypothetical protein